MDLDQDDRYHGWKMGMTTNIAIVPAEYFELMSRLSVNPPGANNLIKEIFRLS